MRRGSPVLLLALLLVAAACGDSGDASTDSTEDTEAAAVVTTEAAAVTTAPGPVLPEGCSLPPLDVEIRTGGDGPLTPFAAISGGAVRKLDGRAYTVYLTDYPLTGDASVFSQVSEPPAGSVTVQTGIDVFNAEDALALPALEAGVVGVTDWTAGEPATFLSIFTDDEASGFNVDQAGSTELLYVDDTVVCMRTDIRAESGTELVGTYAVEILEDF